MDWILWCFCSKEGTQLIWHAGICCSWRKAPQIWKRLRSYQSLFVRLGVFVQSGTMIKAYQLPCLCHIIEQVEERRYKSPMAIILITAVTANNKVRGRRRNGNCPACKNVLTFSKKARDLIVMTLIVRQSKSCLLLLGMKCEEYSKHIIAKDRWPLKMYCCTQRLQSIASNCSQARALYSEMN